MSMPEQPRHISYEHFYAKEKNDASKTMLSMYTNTMESVAHQDQNIHLRYAHTIQWDY